MTFAHIYKNQGVSFRCILLILMVLLSTPVFSATTSCYIPFLDSQSLMLPHTVSIPRNAPVGTIIARSEFLAKDTWNCAKGSPETVGVAHQMGMRFRAPTGMKYTGPGAPAGGVPIYETGVPGVGIAAIARVLIRGESDLPWRAVEATKPTGDSTRLKFEAETHYLGIQGVVILVKTGPGITGGIIPAGVVVWASWLDNGQLRLDASMNIIIDTPINVNPWTCTTPDVDVTMGSFKTRDFPTAGSLSPGAGASVPIRFLNCPALGAGHTIQYRIDPTSGTVGRNVAALTGGDSSAKGLGIQLFDVHGKIFPLSQNQNLNGYNSNTGGNYTVPLTARYYATGKVTAGPADSTMTLTVLYQ